MKLVLLAAVVALSACSARLGGPDHDVTISIPAVNVDVRPEHRARTHLVRHYVHRGIRYCEYSNGRTFERNWRYECPAFLH